jgi:hypothetical protein
MVRGCLRRALKVAHRTTPRRGPCLDVTESRRYRTRNARAYAHQVYDGFAKASGRVTATVNVAARMGHDPATMLRHYAHVGAGSQRLAAGLEVLLDGERPPLTVLDNPADEASDTDAGGEQHRRRALP